MSDPSPARDGPPLPCSFNQVLLAELQHLRPKVFEQLPDAEPMARWGVPDKEWDAKREARAKNLRELYVRVGQLKEGDEERSPLSASKGFITIRHKVFPVKGELAQRTIQHPAQI